MAEPGQKSVRPRNGVGLGPRVVVSHVALVLLALLVFSAVILSFADRRLDSTALQVDRAAAQRLAPLVAETYARSGTWRDVERLLARGMPMPSRTMPMMRRMQPGLEPDRFLDREILIRDASGAVVVASPSLRDPGPFAPDRGVQIIVGGETAGYLYLGSMLGGGSSPLRRAVLGGLVRAAAWTGLIVLLAALAMAALWSHWLLTPLRQLDAAAARLADGQRDIRVPVPAGGHELSTLAETFNFAVDEISRQEHARRRFVADAAHELRTPISLLSTRLEMIRDGVYQADAEQLAALDSGVQRLAALVGDLQTLARIDAGRLQVQRDHVSLGRLFSELSSMFGPEADQRGTRIELHIPDPDPVVWIDSQRMSQALGNLLGNALRYAGADGPVELSGSCRDQDLELVVGDQGPGIPQEEHERIFERFVRIDSSRSRQSGGSGLGLAIARDLIELHGGQIRIDGPPGTRMVVTIPGACTR